jgi:hypothetical protein
MIVEYTLPNPPRMTAIPPSPRPARVAILVALAHRFDHLLQSGEVKNHAELASMGHVTRARVTQIMNLLNLAVAVCRVWYFGTGSSTHCRRCALGSSADLVPPPQKKSRRENPGGWRRVIEAGQGFTE